MDDLMAFGTNMVFPREPACIYFFQYAKSIPAAMKYFRRLGFKSWLELYEPKSVDDKNKLCLGLLPLYAYKTPFPMVFTITDNLFVSQLTDLYCHSFRCLKPVKGESPSQEFHRQLPEYAKVGVKTYRKFTGKDLLSQDRNTWEIELSYRASGLKRQPLFPVCIAAVLYNEYNAKVILDLNAEWGDRLIAACAGKRFYVGLGTEDPMIYDRIIARHGTGQQFIMNKLEDGLSFDFMLSQITSQHSVNEWERLLSLSDTMLDDGAYIALQVDDGYDDLVSFCGNKLQWKPIGYYLYAKVQPRFGYCYNKDGTLQATTIHMFRKPASINVVPVL